MATEINIRNKRASFDYEFIEEYNAGIVLTGTEIKSIRAGKASLVDSYCYFHRGELWVKGMNIAEYLDSIYKKYGFYSESLLNVVLEGAAGAAQIRKILTSLRENPPKEILGSKVVEFKDFGRDTIKDCDGDVIPKEDFYFFSLENGMKIAVRGSGTEPKCKFYIFASNGNPDLAKAKAEAAAAIESVKVFLKEDAMKRANA